MCTERKILAETFACFVFFYLFNQILLYTPQVHNVIVHDLTDLRPVKWSLKTFTFLLDDEYRYFTSQDLKFVNSQDLLITSFFYSHFDTNFLVVRKLISHRRFKVETFAKTETSLRPMHRFFTSYLVVPSCKEKFFWGFQVKSAYRATTIDMITRLDFEGRPVASFGSFSVRLADNKRWEILQVFQWQLFTYVLGLRSDNVLGTPISHDSALIQRQLILIRLSSNSQSDLLFNNNSAENIDERRPIRRKSKTSGQIFQTASAFTLFDSLKSLHFVKINFLPTEFAFAPQFFNGPTLIMKSEKTLHLYSLEKINKFFDSVNTSDGESNSHCKDFQSFMQYKKRPCTKSSLQIYEVFDLNPQRLVLKSSFKMLGAVQVNLDSIKNMVIGIRDNEILHVCVLSLWTSCALFQIYVPINFLVLPRISFDTKTGDVIFQLGLKSGQIEPYRQAIFGCDELGTCSSCEMVGFFQYCYWFRNRCVKGPPKTKPEANLCFNILKSSVMTIDYKTILSVKTSYEMNQELDQVYIEIDGLRENNVTFINGIYQIELKNTINLIENLSMFFLRKTGGPMMAEYSFEPKILSSYWGFVNYLLPLYLAVCTMIVFLIYSCRSVIWPSNATAFEVYNSMKSEPFPLHKAVNRLLSDDKLPRVKSHEPSFEFRDPERSS